MSNRDLIKRPKKEIKDETEVIDLDDSDSESTTVKINKSGSNKRKKQISSLLNEPLNSSTNSITVIPAKPIKVQAIISSGAGEMEHIEFDSDEHITQPIRYVIDETLQKRIIKYPYFKLLLKKQGSSLSKKLITIDPKDKTKCYELNWDKKDKIYYCSPCKIYFDKRVSAKIITNKLEKDYVLMGTTEHACDSKKLKALQ